MPLSVRASVSYSDSLNGAHMVASRLLMQFLHVLPDPAWVLLRYVRQTLFVHPCGGLSAPLASQNEGSSCLHSDSAWEKNSVHVGIH